jgi:hypothetical protein
MPLATKALTSDSIIVSPRSVFAGLGVKGVPLFADGPLMRIA